MVFEDLLSQVDHTFGELPANVDEVLEEAMSTVEQGYTSKKDCRFLFPTAS